MTPEEAHAIWDDLADTKAIEREGWLDTAARVEQERGLTEREREAVDVLWNEMLSAFEQIQMVMR